MFSQRIRLLALSAAFALTCPVVAQVTTATFYGIVADPSGAAIENAEATLVNEGTQATLKQITSNTGEFAFNFVPVGVYTLRIQAPGFKTSVSSDIQLSAGENIRRTFNLGLGAVSESVEVTAATSFVNTVSAEQRESVTTRQVTELPIARRNVANVVTLTSGATRSGGDVYLNGSGRGGTSISVDGTDATGNPERPSLAMFGDFNYINGISMEAVGEVQITKGVIPAEYTRAMGGNLNIISRSGTNQFHGSLFHNFRADDLNARNQILARKPGVTFNQFGGSLGGPVIKDRIFMFGVYEGYRERAFQAVEGLVPSARLRADMLAAVPAYALWLDTVPLPNQPLSSPTAPAGQYIGAGSLKNDENHFILKPDVRITDWATASLTYTRFRPTRESPRVQPVNSRIFNGETDRYTASVTLFRSRWTSETRYGYNRNVVDRIDAIFNIEDPNKQEGKFGARRIPCISISLFSGGCGEILTLGAPNHSIDQKIAFVSGRHSLKFGGVFFRRAIGRSNIENPSISYQNEADLLANNPSQVQTTFGTDLYQATSKEFGFFIQDDWRVNPKLVINLGIRNDYFGNYVAYGPDGGPPNSFNRAGYLDTNFTVGPVRPIDNPYDSDAMNLAPRVGFSYNPDGQSKNVIRGGASTMFTNLAGETVTQTVQNSLNEPFRSQFSQAEAQRLGLLFPTYNEDALRFVTGGVSGGSPRVLNPNLQSSYSINLYLGYQRELMRDVGFEAAYVGNRGVKWLTSRTANRIDRATGLRPNPGFGTMDYWDNSDNTWYNSLQTSIRIRNRRGLTANFHYTYSKAIAYGSGDTGWTGSNEQNFFDLRSNRGLADGSILHAVVADVVYETPRLSGFATPLRAMFGAWQLSTVFTAQTGPPVNLTHPTALSGSRPDYVGGEPILDDYRDTLQYINKAAFAPVPENQFRAGIREGNVGRNALRAPGLLNFDFALGKNFYIKERYRFQIRGDFFNGFNHTNYSGLQTNVLSPQFGRLNGTRGAREIQLNARFSF